MFSNHQFCLVLVVFISSDTKLNSCIIQEQWPLKNNEEGEALVSLGENPTFSFAINTRIIVELKKGILVVRRIPDSPEGIRQQLFNNWTRAADLFYKSSVMWPSNIRRW